MKTNLANFSDKYRTGRSPEWALEPDSKDWHTVIPCKSNFGGEIFTVSESMLGYCSELNHEHGSLRAKLLNMPGVVMAQDGDWEFIVHFPVEMLDEIAEVVHARKKMVISEERKRELTARCESWNLQK